MESIQVQTQRLREVASDVHGYATDYYKAYEDLYTTVKSFVGADWNDETGKAFQAQLEGFRDDFENMKKLMDQYATYMEDAAKTYENTNQNIVDEIKGLTN